MQKITSAATSVRIIPRMFNKIVFAKGTVNLDIGGGKYDDVTELLASKGVQNLVYDPYNRSDEHNMKVLGGLNHQADTVTVANVLNVIDEAGALNAVISQASIYLKDDGVAFFQVYEGDKTRIGKATSKGYQRNMPTKDYLPLIKRYFKDVTLEHKIITARNTL